MLRKDGFAGDLPITVEEARTHCRAPSSHIDQVETYLRSALAYVEEHTGLSLFRQDYILELCDWPSCIKIPVFPVRDITAVKYWDENEVEQTVDVTDYRWVRTTEGAELRFLSAFDVPTLQDERTDVVRIFIEGGFDIDGSTGSGDDAELILSPIAKQCVLMLTEHWYENRSAADNVEVMQVPFAVHALLAKLRIYT